jgi:hypothetical protein
MVAVPLGPAQLDIHGVRAGDLNQFQLTLVTGGRPMDLTGQTITASAKLAKSDSTGLDAVIAVVDGPAGVLTLRWPGDDVRTWLGAVDQKSGVWDLQMTDGTSDPITVLAGIFTAELDVTQ